MQNVKLFIYLMKKTLQIVLKTKMPIIWYLILNNINQ